MGARSFSAAIVLAMVALAVAPAAAQDGAIVPDRAPAAMVPRGTEGLRPGEPLFRDNRWRMERQQEWQQRQQFDDQRRQQFEAERQRQFQIRQQQEWQRRQAFEEQRRQQEWQQRRQFEAERQRQQFDIQRQQEWQRRQALEAERQRQIEWQRQQEWRERQRFQPGPPVFVGPPGQMPPPLVGPGGGFGTPAGPNCRFVQRRLPSGRIVAVRECRVCRPTVAVDRAGNRYRVENCRWVVRR